MACKAPSAFAKNSRPEIAAASPRARCGGPLLQRDAAMVQLLQRPMWVRRTMGSQPARSRDLEWEVDNETVEAQAA